MSALPMPAGRGCPKFLELPCSPSQQILTGNAFDPCVASRLLAGGYDLVISNPPYVRYQTRRGRGGREDNVRVGLETIANGYVPGLEKDIWRQLIEGYSGLADLSIPSWLLAGLLVRSGGRLALVVPATWRSRDYADLIRYMLLRCFALEYIVEDTQPGWFSEALIRTHLVVATRLPMEEASKPLRERASFPPAKWIQISPEAANRESLVGRAFRGESPEADMAEWLRSEPRHLYPGIQLDHFGQRREWDSLEGRIGTKGWYLQLEGPGPELPLFAQIESPRRQPLPHTVRDIVPEGNWNLCLLEDVGIHVGQGLRTGCNRFFYVTVCSMVGNGLVRVRASQALGGREYSVPEDALRPVLRRQSEMPILRAGEVPLGRVLDLRGWVLPEDAGTVSENLPAYHAEGEVVPRSMPPELADLVRLAALSPLKGATGPTRIPELSAVRTNVRSPRRGGLPRFWYMLPDFSRRHLPAVFLPRINHNQPWAETNLVPPVLIDANFSTFWPTQGVWTSFGLKAVLNSVWCRILMEALGTPLGGGALKVEASHLRRLPVPRLPNESIEALNTAGRELTRQSFQIQETIDEIVMRGVVGPEVEESNLKAVVHDLRGKDHELRFRRHKIKQ